MTAHPTADEYLLVPMQPTPNGRLHLGHASGPYLRADVLARHLKREGCRVKMICGSDVYENWILLDSLANGRTPDETCGLFHRLIREDLDRLEIDLDAYLDPRDPPHATRYPAAHEAIVDRLVARGHARLIAERFPVSSGSGRYVVGVWLLGRCPNCRSKAAGNACEACGYHFQPAEILEPRSRLDEGPLTWREESCWWLEPPAPAAVTERVERYGAPADILAVAKRYVEQTGGRIRLSLPSSWGIKARYTTAPTVLCNTYYAYSVYCGELYEEGGVSNALAEGSGVTVVGLFGIDNAIAGLVVPAATALAHGRLKPFDHVAVNYFLDLEGDKFSTSRGHAVWVSELIGCTSVTADEVRYFLSHRCPERGPANFGVAEFVEGTNQLRRLLVERVNVALGRLGGLASPPSPDDVVLRHFDDALRRQAEWLSPARLQVGTAVTVLDAWLDHGLIDPADASPRRVFWWLKAFAVLAEPFVPELSARLWRSLGGSGRPTIAALGDSAGTMRIEPVQVPDPLREADIRPYVHLAEAPPDAVVAVAP